jgi:hypothetical protein
MLRKCMLLGYHFGLSFNSFPHPFVIQHDFVNFLSTLQVTIFQLPRECPQPGGVAYKTSSNIEG